MFGSAAIGARCGATGEHLADPRPVHIGDLEAPFTPGYLLADMWNVIKVGEDQSCQSDEVRFGFLRQSEQISDVEDGSRSVDLE